MVEQSPGSMFSNFELNQLSEEERLYLHAARMGDPELLQQLLTGDNSLNYSCLDYMGRNALHLAVDSENVDAIETLIPKFSFDCLEEGLLHAISKGLLNIVRQIIEHPQYKSEEAKQLKVAGDKDAFFRREEQYQYPPDITPLILAAQHNDHEIIQLFLSRGYTIDRPHPIQCQCQVCRNKEQGDSLKRSRSRLHAYQALSSPAYLALSSQHPIRESFRLRKELIQIAYVEKEFKSDYLRLVEQCMDFTCDVMSLCRGTHEIEAILDQTPKIYGDLDQAPETNKRLACLRLAVHNEEKKFVAHPNTQQHLKKIWYGEEMQFMEAWKTWKQILAFSFSLMLLPCLCFVYLLYPNTWIGRAMRCPISKFMTHTLSHLMFLCLLAATTFRLGEDRLEEVPEFDTSPEGAEHIEQLLRNTFRPASHTSLASAFTVWEWLIAFWILGALCLKCKQVYNCTVVEHFHQPYNVIDFALLSLYIASYSLRFQIYFRLRDAEASLGYVADARQALNNNSMSLFSAIVNKSRAEKPDLNYFMQPCPFQWEWNDPETVSGVTFALAAVLSFARTTYVMPFHELLGPLQISLIRMMADIIRFLLLFLLVLLAFMVGMATLHSEYTSDNATLTTRDGFPVGYFNGLWQTVNTLFFSIFGLVDLEQLNIEVPINSANPESTTLILRASLVLFATFQVLVAIVLVNMLIAMMSHSFEKVQGDTDVEWKFARTKMWLNFIDEETTLPTPFNLIPTRKLFTYAVVWCQQLISDSGDDDNSVKEQCNFVTQRKNAIAEDFVLSRCSYDDIINNIMRRYLFKIDREKAIRDRTDVIIASEVCDDSREYFDVCSHSTKSNFQTIRGKSRSVPCYEYPETPTKFRRTSTFSVRVPHRKRSMKSFDRSTLQLDVIRTGQSLLDWRVKRLLENDTHSELIQETVAGITNILERSDQSLNHLLEMMQRMSNTLAGFKNDVNQSLGFKIKKRARSVSESLRSRNTRSPRFIKLLRTFSDKSNP